MDVERWISRNIPYLDSKKVIVTGANSGVGFEAARIFADRGAHVVMACRNMDRGRDAKERIEKDDPEGSLELRKLDLASLQSVRDFAEEYCANHEELHVLCNNAGIMATPFQRTEDGFEKQFGVNHLGHFALTGHLMDKLVNTEGETRVVTQSSNLHRKGDIGLEQIIRNSKEEGYDRYQAYADSKLANLLFTFELDRRLKREDLSVESIGCHPGFSNTNLQNTEENSNSALRDLAMKIMKKVLAQRAERGALPMVYASCSGEVRGGEYIGPGGLMDMRGLPEKQEPSEKARQRETAERLWKTSKELTGVEFELENYGKGE